MTQMQKMRLDMKGSFIKGVREVNNLYELA